MKIFITGISGFLGSHLAEELYADGHEISAVCRQSSEIPELNCRYNVERVILLNSESYKSLLEGVDVIYHVAGATSARGQEQFDLANVATTRALLAARKEIAPNSLFIFLSSQSASGPFDKGPISPYGKSKLLAEQIIKRSHNWIIVRPPAVFGKRDTAMLPVFRMAKKGFFFSPRDNIAEVALIYIKDLVRFLILLPSCPGAVRNTFLPAYEKLFSWKEFHKVLQEASDKRVYHIRIPRFVVRLAGYLSEFYGNIRGETRIFDRYKAAEFLARGWNLDRDTAYDITGWKPETSITQALRETMNNPDIKK